MPSPDSTQAVQTMHCPGKGDLALKGLSSQSSYASFVTVTLHCPLILRRFQPFGESTSVVTVALHCPLISRRFQPFRDFADRTGSSPTQVSGSQGCVAKVVEAGLWGQPACACPEEPCPAHLPVQEPPVRHAVRPSLHAALRQGNRGHSCRRSDPVKGRPLMCARMPFSLSFPTVASRLGIATSAQCTRIESRSSGVFSLKGVRQSF